MRRKRNLFLYLKYGLTRQLLPIVERWMPSLAHTWARHLFFTPVFFGENPKEPLIRKQAQRMWIEVGGKRTAVYVWGEGKPILLVHGWGGRGTVFRCFPKAFEASGYRIIAFDAPAHGQSSGMQTQLLEFCDAIEQLENLFGPFAAIVGHSLGGVAAFRHWKARGTIPALVMIASPTDGTTILQAFCRRIGASDDCAKHLRQWIHHTYGFNFSVEFPQRTASEIVHADRILLIHDEEDRDVPSSESSDLHTLLKDSSLHLTRGLGHSRILRDPTVLATLKEFIQSRNADSP